MICNFNQLCLQMKIGSIIKCLSTLVCVLFSTLCLSAITQDDVDAIKSSNCEELSETYRDFLEAERQAHEALQESRTQNVIENVVGLSLVATVGVGFVSFSNTSELAAYISEVQEYLEFIRATANDNKCKL